MRERSGVTLIEAIIAVVILGILLAGVVPAFVSNLRVNTESEIRSQAVAAAQTTLDSLRADGAWPSVGAGGSDPSIPATREVDVGPRTFTVAIEHEPYCPGGGACDSDAHHVRAEVSLDGQVYYHVATVYTNLE